MSEEEAIKILNTYKGNLSQQKKNPKITKAIDRIIDALEEKNIFLDLYNKEKEKNKKAIDFINERKKTVNKDMAEETRLQVGTFMWQVDELLEILKGVKED